MGYKVISSEMSTKELLDTAAAKLMAEKGEKFTVRDICQRAGVSIGTFYTYYKSKDEISLERLQYMDQYLLEEYAQIHDGNYAQQLKHLLSSYVVFSTRRGLTFSREVYRCILMTAATQEEVQSRVLYQLTHKLILAGQQHGEFTTALSADALTDSTIALIRGLAVNWCHSGASYDPTEIADHALSIWINGLKQQET